MAVADVYDAVRHRRAYRPAQGQQKALEILSADRGEIFDADVVDALLRVLNSRFDLSENIPPA